MGYTIPGTGTEIKERMIRKDRSFNMLNRKVSATGLKSFKE
jgi:hypothetical protein